MREVLTRYGRHNIGFMWLFAEPMMFCLGVSGMWTLFDFHKTKSVPILPFILCGYSALLMWRNTIGRCGNALEPNRALLHHRNVRVFDLFAARIILEISGASMSFVLLGTIYILTNLIGFPDDVLKMILGWILLGWFCFSLALIVGSLTVLSDVVDRVYHVLSYLFLPISGAFFLVEWLPQSLQNVVVWVPTVTCTELLREGFLGRSVHGHYDVPYLVVLNLSLTLIGLILNSYVSRRVEGE